jgi:hypothetical protein
MSKRSFDGPNDWALRFGEFLISDYIVVFGYVSTRAFSEYEAKEMYIRLYRASDEFQVFGRMLHTLKSKSGSSDISFVSEFAYLKPELYNQIQTIAKRLERLRAFA